MSNPPKTTDVDNAADVLLGRIAAKPQWTDAPDEPGFYWWSGPGLLSHRIVKVLGSPFVGWCALHGAPNPFRVDSQQGKWLKIAEPELPSFESESK